MTADLHRNAQTAIETLLNRNPQLPREITDFAATVAHSTGS
jgi:hypothetical protein